MADALLPGTSLIAKVPLRSPELFSPTELESIRNLVGHTIRAVEREPFAKRWLGGVEIEPTLPTCSAYRSVRFATKSKYISSGAEA
jgi:hypothetical protein